MWHRIADYNEKKSAPKPIKQKCKIFGTFDATLTLIDGKAANKISVCSTEKGYRTLKLFLLPELKMIFKARTRALARAIAKVSDESSAKDAKASQQAVALAKARVKAVSNIKLEYDEKRNTITLMGKTNMKRLLKKNQTITHLGKPLKISLEPIAEIAKADASGSSPAM